MNELTVIERENQRVMTTAVLAEEYGTTNDVISKNFNRNKERYIEGKHYYCLEGDDLREFRANGQIDDLPMNLNKLYLWTEKGAFLHAKSLVLTEHGKCTIIWLRVTSKRKKICWKGYHRNCVPFLHMTESFRLLKAE